MSTKISMLVRWLDIYNPTPRLFKQEILGEDYHLPLTEIKTFSRLSAYFNMFFQSRVYAAHPRVISHSIDGEHVCRCPGID